MSGVRRRLIAALKTAAASLLAFGNPAVAGNSSAGLHTLIVDKNSTAPATGTLTTVNFYTTTAQTITFYIGSLSGTTFTIRSAVDVVASGTGLQTATVSLAVVAGDYFGFWLPASATLLATSGVGTLIYVSAPTKPTSGSYALTTSFTGTYSINFA